MTTSPQQHQNQIQIPSVLPTASHFAEQLTNMLWSAMRKEGISRSQAKRVLSNLSSVPGVNSEHRGSGGSSASSDSPTGPKHLRRP